MTSSTLLTLIVIPAIFGLAKGRGLPRDGKSADVLSKATPQDIPKAA